MPSTRPALTRAGPNRVATSSAPPASSPGSAYVPEPVMIPMAIPPRDRSAPRRRYFEWRPGPWPGSSRFGWSAFGCHGPGGCGTVAGGGPGGETGGAPGGEIEAAPGRETEVAPSRSGRPCPFGPRSRPCRGEVAAAGAAAAGAAPAALSQPRPGLGPRPDGPLSAASRLALILGPSSPD